MGIERRRGRGMLQENAVVHDRGMEESIEMVIRETTGTVSVIATAIGIEGIGDAAPAESGIVLGEVSFHRDPVVFDEAADYFA